jgi:hypothetical protein
MDCSFRNKVLPVCGPIYPIPFHFVDKEPIPSVFAIVSVDSSQSRVSASSYSESGGDTDAAASAHESPG